METYFWQKDIETASRSDIRKMQEKKLAGILEYVEARSGFYQNKFDECGVSASDVSTLDDLKRLPFTERDEIVGNQEEHGGFGTLRCNDFREPGQAIGQTGDRFSRTGKPIRAIVSQTDLATQGMLSARGLMSAGIISKDYLYIADFPQFNLIYMHTGLGSINVQSISLLVGMERAERNIGIYMELYSPTAFFISPSYAEFMGNLILKMGRKFPVKTLLGWNEPGYSLPAVRARIEELWQSISLEQGVKVCDAYGMIETGYLGFECRHQNGIHGFEDACIYEIIDPVTKELLKPGEEGELVVTHLEREGMPLIRYRTGDITSLDDSPCPCGRTHVRMKGIKGRWAERLEVKGINIYSSQVDEAMARIREYKGGYNILVDGDRRVDQLEVAVDKDQAPSTLATDMKARLEKELRVPVKITAVQTSDLLIYPHRSRRIIEKANREDYRKEAAAQMAVET
jgi:phenylacetate-CoA ligase